MTRARDTTGDTTPSELLSPNKKPGSITKRGRPRKRRCERSGPADSKTLRAREQNRIAAEKCRSRRRQQGAKLQFRHDALEQKHRSLLDAQSELMGEINVLKNMVEHGSCDAG